MTQRLPITRKEEDQAGAQKQRTQNRNDKCKSARTSISFFVVYISYHSSMLFRCNNARSEPTIQESMGIHKREYRYTIGTLQYVKPALLTLNWFDTTSSCFFSPVGCSGHEIRKFFHRNSIIGSEMLP